MVREDEMRQRYHEYRGGIGSNGVREPKVGTILFYSVQQAGFLLLENMLLCVLDDHSVNPYRS